MVVFFIAGCSPAQEQTITSPTPLPTNAATTEPTIAPTQSPTTSPTPTISPIPNDGKYRPPQGNYAWDYSSIEAFKPRWDEYYLPSSFETVLSDDFGTWYSIEFIRIAEDSLPIPEDPEARKKYLDQDLKSLIERRITPEILTGKIIHQEYLQKDTTIQFAVLDLPGGSNMTINGKPDHAIRGVYIVIQGAYSYVISTQISTGVYTVSKNMTQEQIIQKLKQDVERLYSGINFQTDLEVGKNFVPPTITPVPDPMDFVPDMKVPEGLFFPDQGSNNFEGFAVLTKGDWILYRAGLESLIPVPKGWTTVETGQASYILFSPTGDPKENPAIQIKLGYYGYDDDSTTSEQPITETLDSIKADPNFTLITKEVINSDKGYIFVKAVNDSGQTRYVLQVFSKYARNPSGKFFHVITAFTDEKDWEQYYPILQAMLNNWHAYDGVSIAVPLPDVLIK